MARKRSKPKTAPRKSSHRTATKRKGVPQTNPKSLANLQPFKTTEENGGQLDPRINVGGRPKRLGEAYKDWLARVDQNDPDKRTNAERVAESLGMAALAADVPAAKELRIGTEGDTINLRGLDDGQLRQFITERLTRFGIPVGPGGETTPDPGAAGTADHASPSAAP